MNPILHDFASYYRPHRRLFLLDFGSAVFAGLLELALPIAVTLFIDRLLPTGDFRLIIISVIGLLFIWYRPLPTRGTNDGFLPKPTATTSQPSSKPTRPWPSHIPCPTFPRVSCNRW